MKHSLGVLYTTINDNATALEIVHQLLKEKLISCANIFPQINSVYTWKEEIHSETEVVIILKTRKELIEKLSQKLNEIHPYETPCVIELNAQCNKEFFEWVEKTACEK